MSGPVTIAVDAGGADLGVAEVARGAALAAASGDIRVLVFGPAAQAGPPAPGVEVVDAPVSIAKEADPARAVRRHRDASIVQAVAAVAEGRADAYVSGGSTGAALAAGLFGLKRLQGVHRPALAIMVPVPGAPFLLLDAGANVEVRPEHLVQFAHMGAAFMEAVVGRPEPRVALLSNGTEPGRGTPHVVAAHAALAAGRGLRFVGNVEGRDIAKGIADVLVTDGFTGNVVLKTAEGVAREILGMVRGAMTANTLTKLVAGILRPRLLAVRDRVDPENYGGSFLLGVNGTVVIGHGNSRARGVENALLGIARAGSGLVEESEKALAASSPRVESGETA